jgi:hypothetical protein
MGNISFDKGSFAQLQDGNLDNNYDKCNKKSYLMANNINQINMF